MRPTRARSIAYPPEAVGCLVADCFSRSGALAIAYSIASGRYREGMSRGSCWGGSGARAIGRGRKVRNKVRTQAAPKYATLVRLLGVSQGSEPAAWLSSHPLTAALRRSPLSARAAGATGVGSLQIYNLQENC